MLTVSDLSIARGGRLLLQGLSFLLRPGEGIVLRGANGCGKTSLLRVLAGLSLPHAGRVELSPDEVCFAGHLDAAKAALSVTENLQFWSSLSGKAGDVQGALDYFDLTDLSDRPAHHLSAGQRRRLGLARLLVLQRRVWMLDEPTVSLDSKHVESFHNLLAEHLSGGGSLVMSSHLPIGSLPIDELQLEQFRPSGQRALADPFLTGFDA